jgi:uncharacterized membrane protein YeaQ/YmgE (transglycosylase-associated protein family)
MSIVIWLVMGGAIGWLASAFMTTDRQPGVLMNVLVGVVGALLGGWVTSPLVGAATVDQADFGIGGLIVAFQGAIVLLAIVNTFTLNRVR